MAPTWMIVVFLLIALVGLAVMVGLGFALFYGLSKLQEGMMGGVVSRLEQFAGVRNRPRCGGILR